MVNYCPHCGFANSYQFQKPDTCRKCNKSLSFEKIIAEKQIITSSSGLELTAAERRFIINQAGTMTPLDIAKLIFGDQITSSNHESVLVRNFINSLESNEVKLTKRDEKAEATQMLNDILSGKRKKLEVQYEDEEEEGEDSESTSEVPDISGLSFQVDNVEPPKSMTLEDAVFKYATKASPDILNPKKVKINSKKAFSEIKAKYFPKAERSKSVEIQGQ
jgi:hypothetical protein